MENQLTWINWFFQQSFSKYFIKIDEIFLKDFFNFYGIRQKIPCFKLSYDLINEIYNEEELKKYPNINFYNLLLYGHLHSKYILTENGQNLMKIKYNNKDFMKCPRSYCYNFQCLPYGISSDFGEYSIKMFCPNCNNIYEVLDQNFKKIDGACFGSNWIIPFLKKNLDIKLNFPLKYYIPKMFGFKVFKLEEFLKLKETQNK